MTNNEPQADPEPNQSAPGCADHVERKREEAPEPQTPVFPPRRDGWFPTAQTTIRNGLFGAKVERLWRHVDGRAKWKRNPSRQRFALTWE